MSITTDALQGALAFARSRSHPSDIHGEEHWRAVASQGLFIANRLPPGSGRRPELRLAAVLFALFHDCRRRNDGSDPAHGSRGADALLSCPDLQGLDAAFLEALAISMRDHDRGMTTGDVLIGLGWDADRSCLVRRGVEIEPDRAFFSVIAEQDFHGFIARGRAVSESSPEWDLLFRAALAG